LVWIVILDPGDIFPKIVRSTHSLFVLDEDERIVELIGRFAHHMKGPTGKPAPKPLCPFILCIMRKSTETSDTGQIDGAMNNLQELDGRMASFTGKLVRPLEIWRHGLAELTATVSILSGGTWIDANTLKVVVQVENLLPRDWELRLKLPELKRSADRTAELSPGASAQLHLVCSGTTAKRSGDACLPKAACAEP